MVGGTGEPEGGAGVKVLICGDRNWAYPEAIRREILAHHLNPATDIIIEGGARGADTLAGIIAKVMGFTVQVFEAPAGPIRNQLMLDQQPDLIFAFHANIEQSKGTKNLITLAEKQGFRVELFTS